MSPETSAALCTALIMAGGIVMTAIWKKKLKGEDSCATLAQVKSILGTGSTCKSHADAIGKLKGGVMACQNDQKHSADMITEVRADVKTLMRTVTRIETKLGNDHDHGHTHTHGK